MTALIHDSRDAAYRSPVGAVCCGQRVHLCVAAAEEVKRVTVRVWLDDREQLVPMEKSGRRRAGRPLFRAVLEMPERPMLYWYYFIAETDAGVCYYGNAMDQLGGEGMESGQEPASYQITVYDGKYHTPVWMRESVMMQIMVDRFRKGRPNANKPLAKGAYFHRRWAENPDLNIDMVTGDGCANDFFGGDLRGVTEKLPYLKKLGIGAIYMNPIFRSRSNHKYDTGDYMQIDPSFGSEADFQKLTARAQELGIRIVLDGVFSHTGADSRYFNIRGTYDSLGAYQSTESPYAAWYTFKHFPDSYDCWWGFPTLPNVNEMNADYRRFIIEGEDSVIHHWLAAGASGWRLDVADELPMDFIRLLRRREKGIDPQAALIGEVWEDPSNKVAYGEMRSYALGDTLDSTMNYVLRDALIDFMLKRIDAHRLVRIINHLSEVLPREMFYSMMNLLGSHDRARIITILGECPDLDKVREERYAQVPTKAQYELGKKRMLLLWRFVCAMPGMPCLYYGDEAGMTGMADPFCRGPYPWGHEDAALQAEMAEIIGMRNAMQVLRTGLFELCAVSDDEVLLTRKTDYTDAFGVACEPAIYTYLLRRE